MTYSCSASACVPLSGVPGLSDASVLTTRDGCFGFVWDFVLRLTLLVSGSGTAESSLRTMSFSLVGYALGINSSTVMRWTTRCSLSFARGFGAYMTRRRLTCSTVSSSRFITKVFPFCSSTKYGTAAAAANL